MVKLSSSLTRISILFLTFAFAFPQESQSHSGHGQSEEDNPTSIPLESTDPTENQPLVSPSPLLLAPQNGKKISEVFIISPDSQPLSSRKVNNEWLQAPELLLILLILAPFLLHFCKKQGFLLSPNLPWQKEKH